MKKQLIILTTIALAAGVTACSSLDLTPKDRVSQFDYFKSATDLELFTNPYVEGEKRGKLPRSSLYY